jgi:hypothetical protein
MMRAGAFLLLGLFAIASSTAGQAEGISWPEAVGQLAGQRTMAETCIALMKRYGDEGQIARGQLTYGNAKSDFDSTIAGLIATLSAGQAPETLSNLQTKITSGVTGLRKFCDTVSNLLPKTTGEKGVGTEIAKAIPIADLLKMLSGSVSTLYTDHRSDDALTRKTIQTQLEAARWPAFSEVKAAQ